MGQRKGEGGLDKRDEESQGHEKSNDDYLKKLRGYIYSGMRNLASSLVFICFYMFFSFLYFLSLVRVTFRRRHDQLPSLPPLLLNK